MTGDVKPPLRPKTARERLIVALDLPTREAAIAAAKGLQKRCEWVKVGLELFVAAGPAVVAELRQMGFKVFLDLKLMDIPNTVVAAVKTAAGSGASMLTVHAAGGPAMLAAAANAAAGSEMQLLAVTVLTSMNEAELNAVGVMDTPAHQVSRLAAIARGAGLTGMVCSAQEAHGLRTAYGDGVTLVVPGIRPADAEIGDQKRIATPEQALRNGADYLVIGRPILAAKDPAAALEAIVAEMERAG
jgi:orotidine-5'-phosphate decarboxylase